MVSWQSEVLTVWRRLHIERDSMQAPPDRAQACPGRWMVNVNTVCGRITNVAAGPGANQSLVTTDQFLEDTNQYENGRLRLGPPPARQFPTVGNSQGPNATVIVQNDASGAPPNNQPFDLHDDDNDAILPRLPDLGWMQNNDNPQQNLFAMAYIRPVDDGGGGKTGEQDFPFDLNTDDSRATNSNFYTYRQSFGANSPDYWVVYLLSIFQGPRLKDFDPHEQLGIFGLCVLPGNPVCGALSILYVEQYRDPDGCGGLNPQAGVRSGLQATVVHEVGHSLGGIHSDGGVMAPGCLKNPQFTDTTLNRIRSVQYPGGGSF